MGVLIKSISSSCLMKFPTPRWGLRGSSDGRVADRGVRRVGRLGLGDAEGMFTSEAFK